MSRCLDDHQATFYVGPMMQMAKIADSPVGRVLHDLFNSVMDPAIICYSTM